MFCESAGRSPFSYFIKLVPCWEPSIIKLCHVWTRTILCACSTTYAAVWSTLVAKCELLIWGFLDASALRRRSVLPCPSYYGWIYFTLLYTGDMLVELFLITVPGPFDQIEQVGSRTSARFESQPVDRLCWLRGLWVFSARSRWDQNISWKFNMTASSPIRSSSPIAVMISCCPTQKKPM